MKGRLGEGRLGRERSHFLAPLHFWIFYQPNVDCFRSMLGSGASPFQPREKRRSLDQGLVLNPIRAGALLLRSTLLQGDGVEIDGSRSDPGKTKSNLDTSSNLRESKTSSDGSISNRDSDGTDLQEAEQSEVSEPNGVTPGDSSWNGTAGDRSVIRNSWNGSQNGEVVSRDGSFVLVESEEDDENIELLR